MDAWQTDGEAAAPDAIRRHVERRTLMLSVWVAAEVVLCAGMLAFLLHRAATDPDPVERLAMGLLALITAGAVAFSLWNWRGAIRASTSTTSAFVALSLERSRRLRRAIYMGWAILAAEVVVFVPWVWHRLYGGPLAPSVDAERFGWGLLAGLTTLAMVMLAGLHAWARREARILDELRKELEAEETA
ncbi:MAG: hypothetical protein ACREU4_09835 [Burkholderiales bacterium]